MDPRLHYTTNGQASSAARALQACKNAVNAVSTQNCSAHRGGSQEARIERPSQQLIEHANAKTTNISQKGTNQMRANAIHDASVSLNQQFAL
jgi:hypothetical protein